MSGGAFDYRQYYIEEIADDIEKGIIEAGREIPQEVWEKNHWYGGSYDDSDRTYPTYERKTIDIMKRRYTYCGWLTYTPNAWTGCSPVMMAKKAWPSV